MRKLIVKNREVTSVCVKTGDTAAEQYAGSALRKYLDKLGIPEGDGGIFTLSLDESIDRDGYRIDVTEDGIAIAGGNGRGVIYGVYDFLEKYAGARYFTPTLETLGEGDIVVAEGCSFVPVFEFRESDLKCGMDVEWRLKQHINDARCSDTMPGGCMEHGFSVHSMAYLTGVTQREQPCLSDPEIQRKVIVGIREFLSKNPTVSILSISQNDNGNYCKCEKCAAIDAAEGSPSGSLLRFINAIAEDIAKDYPDVVIETLAYWYTRKPPKITKAAPNVCIRLCSSDSCYIHPLNDRGCTVNSSFYDDIIGWQKACSRMYIWDYTTDFVYYIPTFPNLHVLRKNMRFFADCGVSGIYPQGQYNSPRTAEFGELKCYLLAKLMWNPYMSETEYYRYMDEFLAAYYGDGWRYIRAYIDVTCMESSGSHAAFWDHPFKIIPADKWAAMEETFETWWDKAEEMAGERLENVQCSRLQWRYIRLLLHPCAEGGRELAEDVKKFGVRWFEGSGEDPNPDKLHLPPTEWFR